MRRLAAWIAAAIAAGWCLCANAVTDLYAFRARLCIPQVKNNTASLGVRKYEWQTVSGTLVVEYSCDGQAAVALCGLTNRSFKVAGERVTYEAYVEGSRWNLVGDNRTGVFKKPSVWISADLQPSYVSSYEPTDDNSLLLSISGRGSSAKSIHGYVTGTLGCGCADYGHVSPTRVAGACGPLPVADDVAAVYGTWSARRVKRIGGK